MKPRLETKQTSSIPCPKCNSPFSSIIDTRFTKESQLGHPATRRRRVCLECDYRFTTYEFLDKHIKQTIRNKVFVTQDRLRHLLVDIKKELAQRYK